MKQIFFFLFIINALYSCGGNKYLAASKTYSIKSVDGKPDYSNIDFWAAHPWKKDVTDSVPAPLKNESSDSLADVFFIHPTTYLGKFKTDQSHNAIIDDNYLNAKTDLTAMLYQASVFNQHCRIFAPRYRQAHYSTFFIADTSEANKIFDIAYSDIKNAFEYYLQHYNNGRPIIIAGHSQGSKLAEWLLKDYFENKPLQKQLVVAYVPGWSVPKELFTSLKMCTDSLQTGCICSWRTVRKGYIPPVLKNENGNSYVTNPLIWQATDVYASKKMNKGSVLTKFNKVYKHTTDAQIVNGLLWVNRPKFPWSFLYRSKNYHVGDINLYYINLRENIATRIHSYLQHY